MTADDLAVVRVAGVGKQGRLAWAENETVRIPAGLLTRLDPDARPGGVLRLGDNIPSGLQNAVQELRFRAAFIESPPVSSRLPIPYYLIPSRVRSVIASFIGKAKRRKVDTWAAFPGWPMDLSVDFLSDVANEAACKPHPCPVILTHDLDSEEGLANAVQMFFPLEEAVGARSTNYIVPCRWSLDEDALHKLTDRGHELGIHGYDHANRTPFSEPGEMLRRVEAARPLVERYGIRGYRAPSLLRTPKLYEALSGLYAYDSSIPTSGGLFPTPNNGCATARPFLVGSLPVLPLSMPRDGSLRFLGHEPEEILTIWKVCAQRIAASGGCVVLLTHCEKRFSGNPGMLEVYRKFLDFIATDAAFAFSSPEKALTAFGYPLRAID